MMKITIPKKFWVEIEHCIEPRFLPKKGLHTVTIDVTMDQVMEIEGEAMLLASARYSEDEAVRSAARDAIKMIRNSKRQGD